MACLRWSGISRAPFLKSRSLQGQLPAEALQFGCPCLQRLGPRRLLLGEGGLAPSLVLFPPPQEHALGQVVLPADLRRSFLAGGHLAHAIELELPVMGPSWHR